MISCSEFILFCNFSNCYYGEPLKNAYDVGGMTMRTRVPQPPDHDTMAMDAAGAKSVSGAKKSRGEVPGFPSGFPIDL